MLASERAAARLSVKRKMRTCGLGFGPGNDGARVGTGGEMPDAVRGPLCRDPARLSWDYTRRANGRTPSSKDASML